MPWSFLAIAQEDEVYTSIEDALDHKEQALHLNLSDKNLRELPASIGELSNLRTLILAHNNLTELPKELKRLQKLTYLDLRDNNFPLLKKRGFYTVADIKVLKKLPANCKIILDEIGY